MIHKQSGIVTPIVVEHGKFIFNIWVENDVKDETDEKTKRVSQREAKRVSQSSRLGHRKVSLV